jgi:hypothetical protein
MILFHLQGTHHHHHYITLQKHCHNIEVKGKVKVEQSQYMPVQALRVLRG